MRHFYQMLHNFLNGKSNYGPIRRILGLVFSLSITSFLFERFFYHYTLLDISDYKGAIEFFLKGTFFLPFVLFLVVHYGISFIATVIFSVTATRISHKWVSEVFKLKVRKSDLRGFTRALNKLPIIKLPIKLSESMLLEIYSELKASVTSEQWKKALEWVKEQQGNIEKNYSLLFKGLAVTSIYYFSGLPYFGLGMYIFLVVVCSIAMYILWYFYIVLDVTPVTLRRIDSEVQQHLAAAMLENQGTS